jgi:hypothetical protein
MPQHVLRPTRRGIAGTGAALGLAAVCAQLAVAAAGAPAARLHARAALTLRAPIIAHAAGALKVNDTGYLHLLHASGSVLSEEGPVSGTLPGTANVRLDVGANVTASFTIHARGGSISGHGSATLHSSGRYSSFAGTLWVNRGTGRFAHARGTGKLYGVIERRTDKVTVQTREGTLHY